MHLIGLFMEPDEVGGLVDALKNSGIERRDMIISANDPEKFATMEAAAESHITSISSDQEDPGEMGTFAQGVKAFEGKNGIVVSVKAARHKAQEVKAVMEQSGAVEIVADNHQ